MGTAPGPWTLPPWPMLPPWPDLPTSLASTTPREGLARPRTNSSKRESPRTRKKRDASVPLVASRLPPAHLKKEEGSMAPWEEEAPIEVLMHGILDCPAFIDQGFI